jgi:hypothetical protein
MTARRWWDTKREALYGAAAWAFTVMLVAFGVVMIVGARARLQRGEVAPIPVMQAPADGRMPGLVFLGTVDGCRLYRFADDASAYVLTWDRPMTGSAGCAVGVPARSAR